MLDDQGEFRAIEFSQPLLRYNLGDSESAISVAAAAAATVSAIGELNHHRHSKAPVQNNVNPFEPSLLGWMNPSSDTAAAAESDAEDRMRIPKTPLSNTPA